MSCNYLIRLIRQFATRGINKFVNLAHFYEGFPLNRKLVKTIFCSTYFVRKINFRNVGDISCEPYPWCVAPCAPRLRARGDGARPPARACTPFVRAAPARRTCPPPPRAEPALSAAAGAEKLLTCGERRHSNFSRIRK